LQSHLGGIEHLQSHLHSLLLRLLTFGFHASSSFGDNHSDSGHIHCNSSNTSAQVAALFAVCAGQNLSPLIHSCRRPCVHYLGDPGNATTRLECRLTTLGTDRVIQILYQRPKLRFVRYGQEDQTQVLISWIIFICI
jgi:hypothetical protein